jgi:hypothetical protein
MLYNATSLEVAVFFGKNLSDDERFLGLRTRKLATSGKLRASARECQLLVNFGSGHIPA